MTNDHRDVTLGLTFLSLGLLFFFLAYFRLPIGTAARMGPGLFPVILGGTLAIIGTIITVSGLLNRRKLTERVPIEGRGIVFVVLSILVFIVGIIPLGLSLTIFLSVVAAAFASKEAKLVETVLLGVGLSAFCSWLFVIALGVPIPLVGRFTF